MSISYIQARNLHIVHHLGDLGTPESGRTIDVGKMMNTQHHLKSDLCEPLIFSLSTGHRFVDGKDMILGKPIPGSNTYPLLHPDCSDIRGLFLPEFLIEPMTAGYSKSVPSPLVVPSMLALFINCLLVACNCVQTAKSRLTSKLIKL